MDATNGNYTYLYNIHLYTNNHIRSIVCLFVQKTNDKLSLTTNKSCILTKLLR